MAETLDLSVFVGHDGDGSPRITLAVEGIDCAACIDQIEGAMRAVPGVQHARLNYTTHRLTLGWREGETSAEALVARLAQIGYRAHPFVQRAEEEEARHAQWLLRCLGVAGFGAMNVMLLSVSVWSGNVSDITSETRDLFHWVSALIAIPAAAYAGQPFFRSAMRAIRLRNLNMDVPISLGVILALGMSVVETARSAEHAYFDSALMLLFFLLAGRYLDHAMRRKTRAVAGNLSALRSEVAHRFEDQTVVTVPVAALRPGDRLLVKPGERVPADVQVLSGRSEIDESVVTGETARRPIQAGDPVYCGSLNYEGALTVRVTAANDGTLLDEVERLLEKAVESKSRHVQLADRAARLYAPVVHVAAAATAVGWLLSGAGLHDSIITAIAVLIITCPCALALAVPTVQVVAAGALFRSGVLLNHGDALERFADIDTVVFDKTGTLTLPQARVTDASALPPDLLERAARLALSSHHPLARAVAHAAPGKRPYDEVVEEPGQGVRALIEGIEARLGSPAYCEVPPPAASGVTSAIAFRHGARSMLISVAQSERPDARAVSDALRRRGLDRIILSGDRAAAVMPVAATLHIDTWRAGLKPAEKIAALDVLKAEGRKVMMVGDGVNDAPALACAHVSVSPISAANIAQAHADAVFLGDSLKPVLAIVEITARARLLMRQNLWLAVVYNAIAVPLAVAGHVTPLVAALAMSGSSVLVTVNALRGARVRRSLEPPRPRTAGEVETMAMEAVRS